MAYKYYRYLDMPTTIEPFAFRKRKITRHDSIFTDLSPSSGEMMISWTRRLHSSLLVNVRFEKIFNLYIIIIIWYEWYTFINCFRLTTTWMWNEFLFAFSKAQDITFDIIIQANWNDFFIVMIYWNRKCKANFHYFAQRTHRLYEDRSAIVRTQLEKIKIEIEKEKHIQYSHKYRSFSNFIWIFFENVQEKTILIEQWWLV